MRSSGDEPTQPLHPRPKTGRGVLPISLAAVLLIVLAVIGLFSAWIVPQVFLRPYDERIYPRVYVLGVDVGGLTPAEAAARLAQVEDPYGEGVLVLRDGQRTWTVRTADLGMRLNVEGTVQTAFAVGRSDQSLTTLWAIWLGRHEVAPVLTLDPAAARAVLEALAPEVSQPPVDATLRLEGSEVVAVPGQPGRVLNVDATLETLIITVAYLGLDNPVALAFQAVPPRVTDAGPARAQAEEMLARQVNITTYDVLTDENFSWSLGREELIAWLRVEPAADGSVTVRADESAVRATLDALAAEMGEGRGFRPEAAREVLDVFEAGGGTVNLYLTHPVRTYAVQSGDRVNVIAARFGMPPGMIIEANPGVDLDHLSIGQLLIIPSQDILTPYTPVPGKRVVISIPEQRMRVYENGRLLWDWPVSTGIESSPTATGVFQVLSLEENAYASQWNLWMPHFISIYRAGGEVYNGIHAIPIRNGQRLWNWVPGTPASFGCIILGVEEAETLYNWVEIGVVVVIQ